MKKRCTKTVDIELLILEDKIKELIDGYKQYSDPFNHDVNCAYQNVIDDLEKSYLTCSPQLVTHNLLASTALRTLPCLVSKAAACS